MAAQERVPILMAAVTPLKPGQQPAYPVVWVQDAVLKLDARPVVKGLIEQGAFAVIYGPSGSGKSFFTADIAQHIALGSPWRGRKCPQALVVYVASEAGASILKRFVGWRDNRVSDGLAKIPIAVLTRGPNLLDGPEVAALTDQLRALEQEAQLPLALTVFDTLSRSIPGGDENKAEDMTMAVRAADHLRDRIGCATSYVHHSGKDTDKGARGHSSLFAAADVVLKVMDGCATVEKVRDGVAGERFGFSLEPVEIGLDSDGEQVFTCLLNHSDATNAPKPAPVKGRSALGLQSLREAIGEHGQVMGGTSTIPKGVRAITLTQWRERFDLRYGKDDKTPARQAFYKARESLLSSKLIAISDPFVWLS